MAAEIEESLFSYLSGLSDLSAVVSGRIYPNALPQEVTLPAVTFAKVSDLSDRVLGGGRRWRQSRFQVDAWAEGYDDAKAIERAVRGTKAAPRLDGFCGGTLGGHYVHSSRLETATDRPEPEGGGGEAESHTRMDFLITWEE